MIFMYGICIRILEIFLYPECESGSIFRLSLEEEEELEFCDLSALSRLFESLYSHMHCA